MAHTKSSIKDLKRIKKRTIRNRALRSKLRTFVKKARTAADDGKSDAEERVGAACRVLDQMVTKGIIKKNNASRSKSRLMKRLNITLNIGQPDVLKSETTAKPVKPKRPEVDESTESIDADVLGTATEETVSDDSVSEEPVSDESVSEEKVEVVETVEESSTETDEPEVKEEETQEEVKEEETQEEVKEEVEEETKEEESSEEKPAE